MLTVLVHEYVLRSSLCKKASMQMQVSLWMIAPARQHVTLLCQQKDVERERERKLTYTYPREQFSCCRMTAKTPAYTESKRVQIVNLILATLLFSPHFLFQRPSSYCSPAGRLAICKWCLVYRYLTYTDNKAGSI